MTNKFFKNAKLNEIIKQYINNKLRNYNGLNYAYAITNKKEPECLTVITNKDEWFDIYIKNKYHLTDPVLIIAAQQIVPFSWDENMLINHGLRLPKVFDIAKHYNIISGYSFVIHDSQNNFAVLSLMIDENSDPYLEDLIDNHKESLQMLLINIHNKLTSLYREASHYSETDNNKEQLFSRRENEVLYFASLGKTYKEIGIILDIRLPTVKFHSGNALKKMGVRNIRQGIKIANELNLLNPVVSTFN